MNVSFVAFHFGGFYDFFVFDCDWHKTLELVFNYVQNSDMACCVGIKKYGFYDFLSFRSFSSNFEHMKEKLDLLEKLFFEKKFLFDGFYSTIKTDYYFATKEVKGVKIYTCLIYPFSPENLVNKIPYFDHQIYLLFRNSRKIKEAFESVLKNIELLGKKLKD
jgi:hypothetical protein